MENKEEKKYLPIGTVVLLKGGKKQLMISGYATLPRGKVYDKNGELQNVGLTLYDYCGYFYPEGLISSDKIFAFNHEQIEKIYFKGYESEEYKQLEIKISNDIEDAKKKITEITEILKQEQAEA